MVGFSPDEGETVRAQQILQNVVTDRGTDLDLIIITAPVPPFLETVVVGDLTELTGFGYARVQLVDATWSDSGGNVWTYPEQIFTPAGGAWTNIRGYAILTRGTTPRILVIEDDPNQPVTVPDGQQYRITPRIPMI